MYEAKKEYRQYEEKDEIKYHVPEWVHIIKEYFEKQYNSGALSKPVKQKNKKNSVEDLL